MVGSLVQEMETCFFTARVRRPGIFDSIWVRLQPIVFKNCFTFNTASNNIAHGSGVNARLARQSFTITEIAANVNMQRFGVQ
jgi:hypothetical protein